MTLLKALKWDDQGLIPAVIQDARDGTVLMVAYMNRQALIRTLKIRKSVFWSRSRNTFWLKGESSGNVQRVKDMGVDCDGDCLLIKVDQIGNAACHTGHRRCFFNLMQDVAEQLPFLWPFLCYHVATWEKPAAKRKP